MFITSVLKIFYLYLGYVFLTLDREADQGGGPQSTTSIIYDKIFKYLITSSIMVPGLFIFQFRFFMSEYRRVKISRDSEQEAEEKKKENGVEKEIDDSYLHMTQGMLNKFWERPQMDFDSNYTVLYSIIFLNAMVGMNAPLLLPPLMIFLFLVIGGINRRLLYSRYRRPSFELRNLGDHMIRRLILVPKMMTLLAYSFYPVGSALEQLMIRILHFSLMLIFFFNFDFLLNQFEKFVERRCMGSPGRREKFYSENSSGFGSDYESEYLGVKRSHKVDSSMSAEVSENFGENPM